MNSRTEILSASFKPAMSIVVYKSDENLYREPTYYLESHDINDKGQVLAGKPLTEETLQAIVASMQKDYKDRSLFYGQVPESLIYYRPKPGGKYTLAWYRPAEIRFFHFTGSLKLKSGKMWAPAMLYVIDDGSLYVYALRKDARPDENTRLMRAPFHNVADDGKVCLGNARVKKPVDRNFTSMIKYFEDMFWLSEFAHVNGDAKPTKSDIDQVYRKMRASKEKLKWSDIKEMKESKRQIKSILQ